MAEVSPQTNTASPVPKSSGINWLHVFIGVVIGIVLLGSGFLAYNVLQPKPSGQPQVTTKKSTDSAKTATPSPKPDETANWKVYTNSPLNLSIKTPAHWSVETSTSEVLTVQNNIGNWISILREPMGVGGPFHGEETLNVGGKFYTFVFFTQTQDTLINLGGIESKTGTQSYGITIKIHKSDKDYATRLKEINQILSTFKYLD